MKVCPACRTENSDEAVQCHCGFLYGANAPVAEEAPSGDDKDCMYPQPKPAQRPNGDGPTMVAWLCLVGAVLLGLIGASSGPTGSDLSYATSSYAPSSAISSVAAKAALAFYANLAAGGLFSLFVILWSVGYIVRAISFLPGKDER